MHIHKSGSSRLVSAIASFGAWLAIGSVAAAGAGVAGAGAPPNYGFEFITIGAVGNRATLPHEVPTRPNLQIGAVNYEYRMAKTEVTGADWFEFVQAYAPYVGNEFGSPAFFGPTVFRGFGPGGVPTYSMDPAYNDTAVSFGWRYAARFANWLHHDKAITQSAFENGAYDTSTFTTNPDGTVNDQLAHNPGARFWIPTQDEWVKAAYYDPNKNGPGMEGYWRHPGGQDTPLTGGAPGEPGAQTPAPVQLPGFYPDVGSYPHVNAPWGLLDTSGGQSEWTETGFNFLVGGVRAAYGSSTGYGESYYLLDRIDSENYMSSGLGARAGMRLASAVPSPGVLWLAPIIGVLAARRRRS